MRRFGATDEQIAERRQQMVEDRPPLDVWPEHWHSLQVFVDMGTQWVAHLGMSGLVAQGLRYEALPLVLAAHKRTEHRQPLGEVFAQLRVLERAALDVLNAR